MELVNGHTEYGPLQGSSPTQYIQKVYTSELLSRISRANKAILATLRLSLDHPTFPTPLDSSMSLDRLMVVALVEKLATMFPDEALEERARRGTRSGFDEFMQGVPDVEPEDYDKLPKA